MRDETGAEWPLVKPGDGGHASPGGEELRAAALAPGLNIGRVVVFRSRTGSYAVPAVVTATVGSLNPAGVAAFHRSVAAREEWESDRFDPSQEGLPPLEEPGLRGVPPLTGDAHVHLTVLTPGIPGQRGSADDFEVSAHPVQVNVGGTYQEWDVPFDPDGAAGTWSWPERR